MTKILVDLSAATEGFGIAEFSVTEARSRLVMIQKFCKPSAPTDDFGIAEFSVTEARFGLIMIPKQLNIEKMREERKKEKKKEENWWFEILVRLSVCSNRRLRQRLVFCHRG